VGLLPAAAGHPVSGPVHPARHVLGVGACPADDATAVVLTIENHQRRQLLLVARRVEYVSARNRSALETRRDDVIGRRNRGTAEARRRTGPSGAVRRRRERIVTADGPVTGPTVAAAAAAAAAVVRSSHEILQG